MGQVKESTVRTNTVRTSTTKARHLLAVLSVAISANVAAGEAHEHGKVALTLAVEDGQVEVSWRSPAVNLVGFEHQPKTAEEKQKIEKTLADLKQGYDQLVLPESALCLLKEADVETSLAAHDEDHDHEGHHDDHDEDHDHEGYHDDHDEDHDHEGHHDDHDEDHDHEGHHDDHDEDHDHEGHHDEDHDHEHDGHADFSAKYTFECRHPEHLKQIEVNLMPSYPGIDEIRYQAITPSGQTGGSLTQGITVIVF